MIIFLYSIPIVSLVLSSIYSFFDLDWRTILKPDQHPWVTHLNQWPWKWISMICYICTHLTVQAWILYHSNWTKVTIIVPRVGRRQLLFLQNKVGFLDRSSVKPDKNSPLRQQWGWCNAAILSWVMNSIPKLFGGIVFYPALTYGKISIK